MQLHFSVDEKTAQFLMARANARGVSLSRYLAEIVQREVPDAWPPDYLARVVGSCAECPLEEVPDLPLDDVGL